MKLSEFIARLQTIQSQMGSHPNVDDSLRFYFGVDELEIEDIEPSRVIGCNCWCGVVIELTLKDDTAGK